MGRPRASESGCISVIVTTYNSGRTIEACLQGIINAVPERIREIIVVDNGSVDRTIELVRNFPVKLEQISRGFVSRSRNIGVKLACHELVAFVDSDCIMQDGWSDRVIETLGDVSVGAAGSRYALRERASWVERAWDRAHRGLSFAGHREVRYIPGGNMAMRRDLFLAVGGFDEMLETGEDMDLCARLTANGYRIVETPEIRCVHLGEPRSLAEVFRRNRWHGRGARLWYADGRLAPIMAATLVFAATLSVAGLGVIVAALSRSWWPALAVLGVSVLPVIYAARYAKPPRPVHMVQLSAIYIAYFLGRTAALPVAARRVWLRGALGPEHASHRRP
jgi:GT2 family glycosyltransferase